LKSVKLKEKKEIKMNLTEKLIMKIDRKAGNYIKKLTPKEKVKINYEKSMFLAEMFNWSKTPQGRDYWFNIKEQIRHLRNAR